MVFAWFSPVNNQSNLVMSIMVFGFVRPEVITILRTPKVEIILWLSPKHVHDKLQCGQPVSERKDVPFELPARGVVGNGNPVTKQVTL